VKGLALSVARVESFCFFLGGIMTLCPRWLPFLSTRVIEEACGLVTDQTNKLWSVQALVNSVSVDRVY
jgi:hypothetical protein